MTKYKCKCERKKWIKLQTLYVLYVVKIYSELGSTPDKSDKLYPDNFAWLLSLYYDVLIYPKTPPFPNPLSPNLNF